MQPFSYQRVATVAEARTALLKHPHAHVIAGGTTLLDLMKAGVEQPDVVIDINRLPLATIDVTPSRVRIGALARNSDLADDKTIAREFPMLAQALDAGASGQLRNMATVGGNLLQRTRCSYFRDNVSHCNKRVPGSGCDAIGGFNRMHAVLGTSNACIATNPSDMNVALAALDAVIIVQRESGEDWIPFDEFYRLPGETPERETVLNHGDVIIGIELTPGKAARHSTYLKLRDRASYEFALVSVAAGLEINEGMIVNARIALGGVGTIPWRATEAERILLGAKPSAEMFARAATAAMTGAVTTPQNAFKTVLAQRAIVRALHTLVEQSA